MNEEFLQFLWRYKYYKPGIFFTDRNQQMEVIHPGLPNSNSGPDFFNAKVKLDDVLWAGNVEIHLNASDWYNHKHHLDSLYDNVVLHVVLNNDKEIKNSAGRVIPCWEMEIPENMMNEYQALRKHEGWIACENKIGSVSRFEMDAWIERMLIEKLEQKVSGIEMMLESCQNDWKQVFFVVLSRNFGFGLNGEPFEQLARQLPWQYIQKNADSPVKLEALMLGQAGFLEVLLHEDKYVQTLVREYRLLKHKYALQPMLAHLWKFLRMRPGNFPTVRLVQLAALISGNPFLFDKLLSCETLAEARKLLEVQPSEYWHNHYRPGIESPPKSKRIGKQTIDLIIINTVVPMLFAFGRLRGNSVLLQRALDWLSELPAEKNSVVDGWARPSIGIKAQSSAQSQGLVYLKRNYCDLRKCLSCRIGRGVLSLKFTSV